jgi:hypothetical protein
VRGRRHRQGEEVRLAHERVGHARLQGHTLGFALALEVVHLHADANQHQHADHNEDQDRHRARASRRGL